MTQPRLLGSRYQLDGVIGRGGMAEVYRARDARLDRVVAIKTLRSDLARDPTFQARFRREAQSAASLNHPSVIAVYDTGEDLIDGNPIPYIVMEYVEGQTLRDVLRDQHQLAPERAVEMVDGILRALDYSHRGGIVHRDIKPANVMLTSSGEVKVMDFGIARALADSAATMTATAQVIGTAQYLSPEQARGERVDARSDLYSTGCVLYELVTGRPPFQGDSPVAIAYQHVREEAPPPSHLDPSIPPWVDAIVMRALAKDPNHRYQSAAEMRTDIQRASQGMPVAAATSVMNSGTRLMSGPPTQTAQPATMGGYDLPPVRYGEAGPPPGGRGKKVALWGLVGALAVGAIIALAYMFGGGGGSPQNNGVAIPAGIVGSTQDDAKSQLEQIGIVDNNIHVKRQSDQDAPKGQVLSVSPAENTQIAKNKVATTEVTLTVSSGKQQVNVPSVRNLSVADATAKIEAAGLTVGGTDNHSSGAVQPGNVIGTTPGAGTSVDKGAPVTLHISQGPAQAQVPNEVGKQVNDAKADLRNQGFKVTINFVDAMPNQPPNTVIDQTPPAGTTVAKGTTVTLTVPRGGGQQPPPLPTGTPSIPPTFPPPGG